MNAAKRFYVMSPEKIKYLNADQLRTFFSALRSATARTPAAKRRKKLDVALLRLIYILGLRQSEAVTLPLDALDLENGKIFIKRLKRRRPARAYPYDLDEETLAALRTWLKERAKTYWAKHGSEFLFPAFLRRSRLPHLSHDYAYNAFKRYARLAGLPEKFSVHCLRHSCAVRMARDNFSAFAIRDYLGHYSVMSTHCYVELAGREREERSRAILQTLANV
jgi:integrase